MGSSTGSTLQLPVIVVTGPRQSGKTTLLRTELGTGFRYVSLEDPDVRAASLSGLPAQDLMTGVVDPVRVLFERLP